MLCQSKMVSVDAKRVLVFVLRRRSRSYSPCAYASPSFLVNGLGWLIFLVFLALAINAVPVRDWTRYFVLACGAFGTFLSTFSVTLNNHLPGAICVMAALYWAAEIYRRPGRDWRYYAAKRRKAEHDLDEAELKPYLQLERMIEAAFTCANRLFGLEFAPLDVPLYHPDCRAWEVTRRGKAQFWFRGLWPTLSPFSPSTLGSTADRNSSRVVPCSAIPPRIPNCRVRHSCRSARPLRARDR